MIQSTKRSSFAIERDILETIGSKVIRKTKMLQYANLSTELFDFYVGNFIKKQLVEVQFIDTIRLRKIKKIRGYKITNKGKEYLHALNNIISLQKELHGEENN